MTTNRNPSIQAVTDALAARDSDSAYVTSLTSTAMRLRAHIEGRTAADEYRLQVLEDLALARAMVDDMLFRHVALARAAGDTWETIGAQLGITKQAAQQRYSSAVVTLGALSTR